ncbi:ABC transporter substrate-binding protein [Planctomicrobium sp. SH527]|uniref:ABC transporter substrate-binding protein n=1 Tax=Planctomicrobium sp. SH527 TaxID=3448123 RepID=UPI003F5BF65F
MQSPRRQLVLPLQIVLVIWVWLAPCLYADDAVPQVLTKLRDMEVPSAEALLNETPIDWIVLLNEDVLKVHLIQPRPFPIQERKEAVAAKEIERIRLAGEAKDRVTREIEDLSTVVVTLPDETDRREFSLPIRQIRSVIHHEELVLRRIELLFTENQLPVAYELLSRLQRERPNWPGVDSTSQKFLFLDARQKLEAGQPEPAFRLFNELFDRNPRFPELQANMGTAVQRLAETAIKDGQFIRAQYFLNQLQKKFPSDPVFQRFEKQLSEQASALMSEADRAAADQDFRKATQLAKQSVQRWPPLNTLVAPFKRHVERDQQLEFGVTELPGESRAYPFPTLADKQFQHITRLSLFEIDRLKDGVAYYRTRLFDDWEPRFLGRRWVLTMRQFPQPHESLRTVTAHEIAQLIHAQIEPNSPTYDERLASFLEGVEIHSPTQLTLHFRRVPARVEPLLASIAFPDTATSADNSDGSQLPGGFRVIERISATRSSGEQSTNDGVPSEISYRRVIAEPEQQKQYHIAEIVLRRFDSPERVVQALKRGEVDMTTGLPDVLLRRLQREDLFNRQFFIQQMQQPVTHLLQFNPNSIPLKTVELRNALAFAIDRQRILNDFVLRDSQSPNGRLVSTPYFASHPGRNNEVSPRRFDISAGFAMALAARHKLEGKLPALTMVVAPGVVANEAAEEIARSWRQIGLTIHVVHADSSPPESWDIAYRTIQMPEPALELWPFLAPDQTSTIAGLDSYPDWIKQRLIQLDRAGSPSVITNSLKDLNRLLVTNTTLIPLWEVDQFLIVRKNIRGFSQQPVHSLQNIDDWTQDAWYAKELP